MIKSKKLQELANTDFITPEQAEFLEQCIENKENIVVAGHKGHGILILLSHLVTCINPAQAKLKQVKNIPADLEAEADYYLVGDLKDKDYEELLTALFSKKDSAVLTLKDPDHNFSLMKIIRDVAAKTNDYSKKYIVVEAKKVQDVKKVCKITRLSFNNAGKIVKEDIFKEIA